MISPLALSQMKIWLKERFLLCFERLFGLDETLFRLPAVWSWHDIFIRPEVGFFDHRPGISMSIVRIQQTKTRGIAKKAFLVRSFRFTTFPYAIAFGKHHRSTSASRCIRWIIHCCWWGHRREQVGRVILQNQQNHPTREERQSYSGLIVHTALVIVVLVFIIIITSRRSKNSIVINEKIEDGRALIKRRCSWNRTFSLHTLTSDSLPSVAFRFAVLGSSVADADDTAELCGGRDSSVLEGDTCPDWAVPGMVWLSSSSLVCSVSDVVCVTNWVKISLIRCIKEFCRFWPRLTDSCWSSDGSTGWFVDSDAFASLDGRASGPARTGKPGLVIDRSTALRSPVSLQSPPRRNRLTCGMVTVWSAALFAPASRSWVLLRLASRCSVRRCLICACDRFCFGSSR